MSAYQLIIQSLLDIDLYKFTILQVVLRQFPQTHSLCKFRCRSKEMVYPLADIQEELERELDTLCQLRFTYDELDYLRSLRSIESDFVDYLELFQLQRRFVKVSPDDQGRLNIRIGGPMIQVMFFEIFILAITNKLYFRRLETPAVIEEGECRLQTKAQQLKEIAAAQNPNDPPFLISGFGTRHCYTLAWWERAIRTLLEAAPDIVRGTSNIYLAKKPGITPIGTMARKFLQTFQALDVRLRNFQKAALEGWVHEYRGDLDIALTDMVGMDAFLRDFNLYFAKLFDDLRHDNGDPYVWGDKAYKHCKKSGVDSRIKMLIFSNGLDIERSWALHQHFKDRFKTSFGIGTNLTNDLGHTSLNIVLKPVECNGQSVAKLSDPPDKTMTTNNAFFTYLRQVFDVPESEEEA